MTPEQHLALVRQAADDAKNAYLLETIAKMRAVLDEMEAAIHGAPRVVFFTPPPKVEETTPT